MGYRVKEIFLSLQGEGANAGRPAVLLRFSGCNLWSGREADRQKGPSCSAWCDTDFLGVNGPGGGVYSNANSLAIAAISQFPAGASALHMPLLVATGGEPLLQMDKPLIHALHSLRFEVAVETNGTIGPVPEDIDWVCVSPKSNTKLVVQSGDELKLIYPQEGLDPDSFSDMDFKHFFLQPMDGPLLTENTRSTIDYCLMHPRWRLSLQIHKFLGLR